MVFTFRRLKMRLAAKIRRKRHLTIRISFLFHCCKAGIGLCVACIYRRASFLTYPVKLCKNTGIIYCQLHALYPRPKRTRFYGGYHFGNLIASLQRLR